MVYKKYLLKLYNIWVVLFKLFAMEILVDGRKRKQVKQQMQIIMNILKVKDMTIEITYYTDNTNDL